MIATDILGHFYTTVLFCGEIYILDSLKKSLFGGGVPDIVEYIKYMYKKSYLIDDKLNEK